jgi:hypothetical protein
VTWKTPEESRNANRAKYQWRYGLYFGEKVLILDADDSGYLLVCRGAFREHKWISRDYVEVLPDGGGQELRLV